MMPLLMTLLGCAEPFDFGSWSEPSLTIRSPEIGEMTEPGEVLVTGKVRNLDHVEVNGVPAEINAFGTFEALVPLEHGINVLEATGWRDEDADTDFDRRSVIAGNYADPDEAVTEGLMLRANQSALDMLMLGVQSKIDPDQITTTAMSMNPVFNQTGALVTAKAVIERINIGKPKLRAYPSAEALEIEARVPEFYVRVRSWGEVFGKAFDVQVRVESQEIVLGLGFAPRAENGDLFVDVAWVDLELIGFDFDVSLIPDLVEELLLVDRVQEKAEVALEKVLKNALQPAIDDALGSLDLSFSTQLKGKKLDVAVDFADAWTDEDGLAIVTDVWTQMPQSLPGAYPGYLLTRTEAYPEPSRKSSVALSISDNLLNNLLFQVWRAGLIDLSMSTEEGTLSPDMAGKLKAEEATLSIRSSLPPVVTQDEGRLAIQLGEFDVGIETPDGELGEQMNLALALQLDMAPRTVNGWLDLGLGEPEMAMMVRDNDWGATDQTTTRMLEEMMPVEQLLGPLNDLAIPMPSFPAGGGIDDIKVVRDPTGGHTNVHINLAP